MLSFRLARKEDLEEVFQVAGKPSLIMIFSVIMKKIIIDDGSLFMKWKKYVY